LLALDRQRLQFVFVLGRNIGDLNQIALSLLKGVPDRRVSLFDREETTALVKLSEQNDTLHWEAEGIQTVWELTNGHPYLTQAICWEVWERIYDRSSSSPAFVKSDDVIAVVDKTLEKSRNTLEWLWGGLGPAEKVVSAALAQADSPLVTDADLETILSESGVRVLIRELREAPQLLQDWDLLEPAQGGYRFRVELLRRWIIRYHPLNLVQKELDTINPAAESLYQAAYSLYQGANLQQATPLLQQSLALNPNHRRAAELLSEIYLAEGNLDKAETLLNGLLDLYPATARPRLVQIYLRNSEETEDEDKKLVYYEKALTISPQHPVALSGKQYIWTMRGEKAIKEIRWEDALHAFKQAELIEKIEWVRQKIAEEAISSGLLVFEQFEHNKDYKKAFQQATALIEKYPESRTRLPTLDILEAKSLLTPKYHQALGALQQGDRDQSIRLLLEIMELEPTYRDVTRYLHLAITGEDINILAEENKHLNEFVKYWLPLPVVRIQLLRTIVAPQIRLINIFRQRAEELKKINKTDDIT
jgi:tetratricopeptide (TPR) repeat protein